MGNESSTQVARVERGAASGVLTLAELNISSWSELVKALGGAQNIRTMSLCDNSLKRAIPQSFVKLPLWRTLTSLDLSGNGLRCACALGSDAPGHTHGGRGGSDGADAFAAPAVSVGCLQVLNLSRNCLAQLPPGLCRRFPTLRKLICSGNQTPLSFPGGLVEVIGNSAALNSVDLSASGVHAFSLVEELPNRVPDAVASISPNTDGTVTVFPGLEELLLEGNNIHPTFMLVNCHNNRSAASNYQFPRLKRVSVANQKRNDLLQTIDPAIYTNAPELNSLDYSGAANAEDIRQRLSESEAFQQWQQHHASVVNKQLTGAGTAALM